MSKITKIPYVDLHVHTTASDGSYSPEEVVKMAANAGLSAIAITDHDSMSGCSVAIEAGKKYGIPVLAGVEISLEFVANTHLLGYFPQGINNDFVNKISDLLEYRSERIPKILEKLAMHGCPVTMEEVLKVSGKSYIGRPHIAKVMVNKKYVKSIQEAFDSYLSSSAPAYVPKRKFDPKEALTLISEFNGVAVLAHPITMDTDVKTLRAKIVEWKKVGLSGIETIYSEYSEQQNLLMEKIAQEENLLRTGGSDFHGASKPEIKLGVGKGNLKIPLDFYNKILEYKK